MARRVICTSFSEVDRSASPCANFSVTHTPSVGIANMAHAPHKTHCRKMLTIIHAAVSSDVLHDREGDKSQPSWDRSPLSSFWPAVPSSSSQNDAMQKKEEKEKEIGRARKRKWKIQTQKEGNWRKRKDKSDRSNE